MLAEKLYEIGGEYMIPHALGFAFFVILISVGLTVHAFRRPIKVSDSHTMDDWFIICILMLFAFASAFLVENKIVGEFEYLEKSEIKYERIIYKCIDGGAMMSLITFLVLIILGWVIRGLKLDYNKIYSPSFIKLVFSVISITLCIKFLSFTMTNPEAGSEAEEFAGRIGAWIVALISMWINFDFPCKDRFELRESFEKKKSKLVSNKQNDRLFIVKVLFAVILIVLLIIFADRIAYKYLVMTYILTGFFVLATLTTAIVMKIKYNPSINRSSKIFRRAFDKYKKNKKKSKSHFFGKMKYYIDDGAIYISPVDVQYDSKNLIENNELFGEKVITIKKYNRREYYLYLMCKRYDNQQNYIATAYKKLDDDKEKQKQESHALKRNISDKECNG